MKISIWNPGLEHISQAPNENTQLSHQPSRLETTAMYVVKNEQEMGGGKQKKTKKQKQWEKREKYKRDERRKRTREIAWERRVKNMEQGEQKQKRWEGGEKKKNEMAGKKAICNISSVTLHYS